MKKLFTLFLLALLFYACDFSKYKIKNDYDFTTVFEKSKGTETATYQQTIEFYKELDDAFSSIKVKKMGLTDSGKPLSLILYNPEGDFNLENLQEEKSIILINNGIHPGESDGIDASMMLLRDLAQDSIPTPENTILAVIPIYNIGGALNRNSTTRVNQNGPTAYGFRGNARNYDLNRDFIKADTENTKAFYEIFHLLNPDVFIDTHVSNGADYQYTLTHLFTQHNKIGKKIGTYMEEKMIPAIEQRLAQKDWPMTPYVNVFNEVPEKGFAQFMDYPRYSTGYTSLWNTMGFMVETHMLKSYPKRVEATYDFLTSTVDFVDENAAEIEEVRKEAFLQNLKMKKYPIAFAIDSSAVEKLNFKGYEPEIVKSTITDQFRLKYNKNKPFEKKINYYNNYKPTAQVTVPKAYIIPKAWTAVLARLQMNQIEMEQIEKDTLLAVQVYEIEDYKTRETPYEGHYLHYNTQVNSTIERVKLKKGDFIVPTNQPGIKYLLETLEPEAVDSFFNWNFFDSILQQKEHFSPYVFEDLAAEFLKNHPNIKKQFEAKKEKDFTFSKNAYAQLEWIYKRTPHYESAHMRYPVFRLR